MPACERGDAAPQCIDRRALGRHPVAESSAAIVLFAPDLGPVVNLTCLPPIIPPTIRVEFKPCVYRNFEYG